MRKDLSALLDRATDAMSSYIEACAKAGFSAAEIYDSVKVTRKAVTEIAALALAAAPAKACTPSPVNRTVGEYEIVIEGPLRPTPYTMQYPPGQNHMVLLCKVHWQRLARGALTPQESEAIPVSDGGQGAAKRLRREGDLKCLGVQAPRAVGGA